MAATKASTVPPPEDVIACQSAAFEWAESFDTKDWSRLSNSIAPTLYVDYSSVIGKVFESLPAKEFVAMASNPHFLGNKRIKTQHFIGAGKWEQNGKDSIKGTHQMRVAHQKYRDDDLKEVRYHGHAHGNATIHYRRDEEGTWKFAGLEPGIRWSEHDYDKIFQPDEEE